MKPAGAPARPLWIKFKLLLTMALGEASARRDKHEKHPRHRRIRTFFEMP